MTVSCIFEVKKNPVVFDVRNVVAESWLDVTTGAPLDAGTARAYPPIERLFERVDSAITRGFAQVDVTYDRARGYPTRIELDERASVDDDEIRIVVSDFRLL